MRYYGNVIRPPSEAESLILQITLGCSHNKCTFCGVYRDIGFRAIPEQKIFKNIDWAKQEFGEVKRVFLADGDALVLKTEKLLRILDYLNKTFKNLQRIGIYASARNILNKDKQELRMLYDQKLAILYIGMESGSDKILNSVTDVHPETKQLDNS